LSTSPTPQALAAFEAAARADGFDTVLERHWPADTLLAMHTHPFDARAVVTQGEFWLTVGNATRHLHPGDTFSLERQVPHSERYGTEGATYWVARRGGADLPPMMLLEALSSAPAAR